MHNYVIAHTHRCPTTDAPLFWSNDDGWVDLESATVFSRDEAKRHNLPAEAWGWTALPADMTPVEAEKSELSALLAQWSGIRSLGGHWTEHPDHEVETWRDEVTADHTRESYDEWVVNQIEQGYYENNTEDIP